MDVLTGWLILILSVAGHTQWWVVFVNRSHSLPYQRRTLRVFRAVHDAAIVLFPFALLWLTGWGANSLLRGGRWEQQTTLTHSVLVITISGVFPLVWSTLRWQLIRRHQYCQADERCIHDVLKSQPSLVDDIRGSRRHPLRHVPGNQILHLEVNTKSVRGREPRVDQPVDQIRIAHLSDLHFVGSPGLAYYRFVVAQTLALNPDLIVFTGDLIDQMQLLPAATEILRPLTQAAPCYFILGNHDWSFDSEQIRQALTTTGWTCATNQTAVLQIRDRRLLLCGSERPWMGLAPPDVTLEAADLRILLCHTPDYCEWAESAGYQLMLSGHTHGGQVVLPVIGPVYAPSRYGVSFASGLFQLGEMTLHVSRGIGAKHPLRLQCLPELTCLTVDC